MDFYFEEIKDKNLSWHWDDDRGVLDLCYKRGIINPKNPLLGQVGVVYMISEEEWIFSLWNNCYDEVLGKGVVVSKKFRSYEGEASSFESAKLKAELMILELF
jgi:hypothetical protein